MNVEAGAIMFMVFGALHNFTEFSSFGPTKDFLTTAVLTSGLHSAWEIGGGTTQSGLEWVFCLAVNLLFSISIQDLRDVVGDAATGRRTTPLMLGQPFGKSFATSWD
jgi:1,4-dihydroxy-2-naphthoate octaprenyltransferase